MLYWDAVKKTSVSMNGLLVPFSHCLTSLQRFCRPVMFHNEDPVLEASHVGSSFLLRYRAVNFVLFSAHQLGNGSDKRQPSEAMILLENERGDLLGRTPDGAVQVRYDHVNARTLDDIVLLNYADDFGGQSLSRFFFELSQFDVGDISALDDKSLVAIFSIGYPTRFSRYELEFDAEFSPEKLNVRLGYVPLYLRKATGAWMDIPHRLPLEAHESYKGAIGDPDGYSGAPVFFIRQDEAHQCHLGFAGMITDGSSSGRFNVYEAARIREILDAFFDTEHP